MKKRIIVTTDFTQSSRNALAYTCSLINSNEYHLQLLYIYTMPITYTTEGMAITSLQDAIDIAERHLADELAFVSSNYPDIDIEQKAIVGGSFNETLKKVVAESPTEMVVIGAVDEYENLWNWDTDLLAALTKLPVPVLLVPKTTAYKPIKNIGFACDYRNVCVPRHINFIKWLSEHTGAQLHIVHVTREKPENETVKMQNETNLQETLKSATPKYYDIESPHVIDAVTSFVQEHHLDFLIVIPHKHDIWYSLFHQSHTKQLARLNSLPILALHD